MYLILKNEISAKINVKLLKSSFQINIAIDNTVYVTVPGHILVQC